MNTETKRKKCMCEATLDPQGSISSAQAKKKVQPVNLSWIVSTPIL